MKELRKQSKFDYFIENQIDPVMNPGNNPITMLKMKASTSATCWVVES